MASRPRHTELTLERHGASHRPAALGSELLEFLEAATKPERARPEIRFGALPGLTSALSAEGPVGAVAAAYLGPHCRPVRAILFDKTAGRNWALGWHQDRTIAVAKRVEHEGYARWTVKDGLVHVEPPFALLATMITLRIHVDPVDAANGPLLVAPGLHRLGLIPEPRIDAVVAACGTHACLAQRGDIWVYSTPILHASEAARTPRRRRVLQIDYAAQDLPKPLRWLGL